MMADELKRIEAKQLAERWTPPLRVTVEFNSSRGALTIYIYLLA